MVKHYPSPHPHFQLCCSTCTDAPARDESVADIVWVSQKKWSTGLGKLLGIELRIHISLWVFLAVLLGFGFYKADCTMCHSFLLKSATAFGVLSAVFFSITVHELAHALVAERLSKPVKGILLHPLGGLTLVDLEACVDKRDTIIYLAGPLANLTVYGILSPLSDYEAVRLIVEINRDIGLFNLIPIFPLDGGNVLKEMLMMSGYSLATINRVILFCSQLCCFAVGIYAFANRDFILVVIIVLLGLLASWLLTEEATQPASQTEIRESGNWSTKDGQSWPRLRVWLMTLLLILMLPQETTDDRHQIISRSCRGSDIRDEFQFALDASAKSDGKASLKRTRGQNVSRPQNTWKRFQKTKQMVFKPAISVIPKPPRTQNHN